MKNTRIELVEKILYITASVVLVGGIVFYAIKDTMLCKKYGKPKYEFVVTDMYEDLGSTWHLVGGRATEQKYHVVYNYRVTNRPDLEDNMVWFGGEKAVTSGRYRKLHVGQTLYGSSSLFPY